MDSIEIRRAVEPDLPHILKLHAQLGMDDGRVLELDQAIKLFRQMATYPHYSVYVATVEAKIVGTFALLVMDNLAHFGAQSAIVEDVVVDERWQHRGIGKAMMQFAMEIGRQHRCYKLVLSSNVRRQEAHAFYHSLGFEEHGLSFQIKLP